MDGMTLLPKCQISGAVAPVHALNGSACGLLVSAATFKETINKLKTLQSDQQLEDVKIESTNMVWSYARLSAYHTEESARVFLCMEQSVQNNTCYIFMI